MPWGNAVMAAKRPPTEGPVSPSSEDIASSASSVIPEGVRAELRLVLGLSPREFVVVLQLMDGCTTSTSCDRSWLLASHR